MKERKDDTARQLTLGIYSEKSRKIDFYPETSMALKSPTHMSHVLFL